jgi:hypothetical protein
MAVKQYKYKIISILYIFICTLYSSDALSQIFEFEQSPPSVKWRQINTSKYQLIYPIEVEKEAQFVANLLDKNMKNIGLSIRTNPRKIPIILRNQSVLSNGFVQLSPRRSEFFITPPQHSDPINWLESLTIHEYRHVIQIDKLTPKPPFELVGLAYFGISLPPWFYEGDAVGIETKLTSAGRGRLPSWEMPMRANTLSGRNYSYQKNYLGSMKDITSGYYELGYFMTTKIKRDFSADILDSVLNRMSRFPIRPYNFSNSLKKYTGSTTTQWYDKTIADLRQKWEEQIRENKPDTYKLIGHVDSTKTTDFFLPQRIDSERLIALSKNLTNTNSIVIIDTLGKQQEIIKTGRQTYPNFSYSNGKITWDEIRYDKRFQKQDYNVINVYDLSNKKYKQLSHKTRLFSPTLSADTKQIAAVEIALNNEENLVILSSETGEEILRIKVPNGIHLQTPSFHQSGKKIIAVGISEAGSNLIEFNLSTQRDSILLTDLNQQFERPIYAEESIIFKAFYNGIDNLYSFDPTHKNIFQLTNIRYGAFNPHYDSTSKNILFNNYQPYGYQISEINLDKIIPQPISEVRNTFISYFKPLVAKKDQIAVPDSTTIKTHASKPYKELSHLFNFHSLSIGSDNFDSMDDLKLGLLLLSDNLLNTMSIRIGAAYDQKIHRPEFSTTISYQRYFPKFNIHYDNSGHLSGIKMNPESDEVTPVRFRENKVKFNVEIPLLFNRLNQIYQVGLKVGSSYTSRYNLDLPEIKDKFIRELKFPLEYQFYFNRNSRRSFHDPAPKWGQNISILYRNSPFEESITGSALSLRSSFYFPGLLTNHSLRTRFNYQYHNGSFQFSNYIPMVNGYDQLKPSLPHNTLLLDYRFPIAYPDWEIGSLAYIQRLKGGFFTHFEDFGYHQKYKARTMGAEIRADMNLLRFFLPIFDVGVTAIYINEPADKKWLFQFGLSYSY